MDKGQILMDYRLAKNHKRQIPILADLNVCDTQTIVEILEEGGYKRMFNTNGVDISVKKTEIEQKYSSGESIAALAMTYHISKKQIKVLLGVEETEEKGTMSEQEMIKKLGELTSEVEKLKANKKSLEERNAKVEKENDSYSIIDNYSSDELKEMGYNSSELNVSTKINMYDEIQTIANPEIK